ncbi:unnamed protein product, partial [Phaeothamnion confervicola]
MKKQALDKKMEHRDTTAAIATTLHAADTGLSACCASWCPVDGSKHLLACATYDLEREEEEDVVSAEHPPAPSTRRPQRRRGGVILYGLTYSAEGPALEEVARNPVENGVLDCKWCASPLNGTPVLASVTSGGALCLHACDGQRQQLQHLCEGRPRQVGGGSQPLLLSVGWANAATTGADANADAGATASLRLVTSDSFGGLAVWSAGRGDGGLTVETAWCGHSLGGAPTEAWTAFFSAHDRNFFGARADDSLTNGWHGRARG